MSKTRKGGFVVIGISVLMGLLMSAQQDSTKGQDTPKVAGGQIDEKVKGVLDKEIEKLTSSKTNERRSAKDNIAKIRNYIIDKLLTVVKDNKAKEDKRDDVVNAIELLSEYRAIEAASILVDMIDYEAPKIFLQDDSYHPAAVALIRIGKPSSEAIGQLILTTDNQKKLELASSVVTIVWGKVEGESFVKKLSEKATTEQAKKNIDTLLTKYYLHEPTGEKK